VIQQLLIGWQKSRGRKDALWRPPSGFPTTPLSLTLGQGSFQLLQRNVNMTMTVRT